MTIEDKRAYRRKYRKEHPEYKEKQKIYRNRYNKNHPANIKEWRKNNREKNNAAKLIRNYVQRGIIKKPASCEICGLLKQPNLLHGHHVDYNEPWLVVWVCPSCHGILHS